MVSMQLDPTFIDLTDVSPVAYRIRNRPSSAIDAVVLHQTGFNRGETPTNYKDVHAHFVVTLGGAILQLHPIPAYLVASSAFNNDAVSIEFVGNFRSDHGDWWKDPTSKAQARNIPTSAQIGAGRDLVTWLRDNRGIWNVFAHRQGELPVQRGNCPGPEIWFHVGEWALRELGLSDGGKGYVEGKGASIPDRWRKQIF